MDSKRYYIEEAYKSHYYAFIKKAIERFGNEREKAFDCIQEIVLRLLQADIEIESVSHARSLIYMSIAWETYHIKNLRKKWGAFREIQCDFTNPIIQDHLTDEIQPDIKYSLDHWPQSNAYFMHISKLNPRHQQAIKIHMLGIGNTEAAQILNKNSKNTIGGAKDEAFKMLRRFGVANKLRNPLDRSVKRRGNDDRTDKIMEMTAAGVSTKEIAERLGLTVGNVKCRRHDRLKLLKKIKDGKA